VPVAVGLREREAERQGVVRGVVEMHLDLVAALGVEAGGVLVARQRRARVQDEHGRTGGSEHVLVGDVEPGVAASEGRVQVMGHADDLLVVTSAPVDRIPDRCGTPAGDVRLRGRVAT